MAKYYADLHCHPTFYAFNRLRNASVYGDEDQFHAWNVPDSDLRKMAEGVRAAAYSQCDPIKSTKGRLRLLFASITPIEAGFLKWMPEEGSNPRSLAHEAVRLATGATAVSSAMKLVRDGKWEALHEVAGILRNGGALRKLVASQFLNYSTERIGFMQSTDYDYWNEFIEEYEFLARVDGVEKTTTLKEPGQGGAVESQVTGCCRLPKSTDALKEILEGSDRDLAFLLTIEGGHTFTIQPGETRAPTSVIMERIEALKKWEHPIFFITLAHHFDNGVCGHAHSIPDAAKLVMNQTPRMHAKLETEDDLGRRVVRGLLDLDENLEPLGGRRILLDVKHMSPQVRQEYYAEFVEPYNRKVDESGGAWPKIPVIYSHAAYSGVATLDALIANQEHETDHWRAGAFNAWGINACDEDIRQIHQSGGLFGLVFEQRICGMVANQKLPREMHARFYLEHIFGVVDVIMTDDTLSDDEKRTIWDCICIGSDFDGMIDPVAAYPTALDLDDFADDLATQLELFSGTRMIAEMGVAELLEKISWRNAYEFTLRQMPAVCGEISG